MLLSLVALTTFAPLPKLSVRGMDLVTPTGKRVLLKGCNLGNWFVIEPWMLSLSDKLKDQYELEQILSNRFGTEEKERLMNVYRSSWITPRDFPIIKSFGMNVVRLPMNYRQFEDDSHPYRLRTDAFKWIDLAISMAEQSGLYTILDMHGVQGGQSQYDHTGQADQNKLWSNPENPKRLAWLWGKIAERYRNRSAVVAYDVFNEPYGGSKPDQVRVFTQALQTIRKVDPDKLVYAMGNYDDFTHYGDPKAKGWRNVGFQMHYYPGLFGGGEPNLTTHARHLNQLSLVAAQVRRFNVPFLIGEMNVVFNSAGGGPMMRKTFDRQASFGWATTMWSYKVLSKSGGHGQSSWGMVANKYPAAVIDFRKASKREIEQYFSSFRTQPYEVNTALKSALIAKKAPALKLPAVPEPIVKAPAQDSLRNWSVADIGNPRTGGMRVTKTGFELFGGGGDIWGRADQFRYLYRPIGERATLEVNLRSLLDVHSYSKGGIMARASLDPAAATVLISAFPSGSVQLAARDSAGGEMKNLSEAIPVGFPLRLSLAIADGTVTASYAKASGPFTKLAEVSVPALKLLGVVALSHDDRQLVRASYSDLIFR